jgi:hypothetical protein
MRPDPESVTLILPDYERGSGIDQYAQTGAGHAAVRFNRSKTAPV